MFVTKATTPGTQVVVVIDMSQEKYINAQSAAGAADWGLIVKITISAKCKCYLPAVLPDVES
jgi:hypothetical protein